MPIQKHVMMRVRQAELIAQTSPCPRGQVGAVLFQPETWSVIADGYNGPPRRGGRLCGGEVCNRDRCGIESGTRTEVGCAHAEFNAVANAARQGASTMGAWCAVTHPPCLMCAKLLHHAGIKRVIIAEGEYSGEGREYLKRHDVIVSWAKEEALVRAPASHDACLR